MDLRTCGFADPMAVRVNISGKLQAEQLLREGPASLSETAAAAHGHAAGEGGSWGMGDLRAEQVAHPPARLDHPTPVF